MLSSYHILTITHKQTALKNIANFVIAGEGDAQKEALNILQTQFGLQELVYMATCNRVLLVFFSDANIDTTFINDLFRHINPQINTALISEAVVHYRGHKALQHLFEVSASIDSLVVGEREILRQIRAAYEQCKAWHLCGENLRWAFDKAVVAAKDVYTNTAVGDRSVSVVALAMDQFRKDRLPKNARILLIGAGQTNTLAAKFLVKYHYNNVAVFNRTLDRAINLAATIPGATAHNLDALTQWEAGFDCLIVCTGATKAIIDDALYNCLLSGDTKQKVVIDLSIPHNVDETVVEKHNMHYIEIEGLKNLADENRNLREMAVEDAREVLAKHLMEFEQLYRERYITRRFKHLPDELAAMKAHTTNVVFQKKYESLDENSRAVLDEMLSYFVKQSIKIPMKAAKELATQL